MCVCARALRLEFLMNLPNLFLNIHSLHPLEILAFLQLPIVVCCCLLPARRLFLGNDWLSRHAIKDITALRTESLKIGRYVVCR